MSIKQMSKVWEHEFQPNEQLVMLALADFADDEGGGIFPSVKRVAWKTGYSKRNTQRIISELRERGVLVEVRQSGRRRATEYRIEWSVATPKASFGDPRSGPSEEGRKDGTPHVENAESGVNALTRRGERTDMGGVNALSPKASVEPSECEPSSRARQNQIERKKAGRHTRQASRARSERASAREDAMPACSSENQKDGNQEDGPPFEEQARRMEHGLVDAGIDRPMARSLIETHSMDRLRRNVVLFRSSSKAVGAGWLVKAIREDYAEERRQKQEELRETSGLLTYGQMCDAVAAEAGLTTDDFEQVDVEHQLQPMWRRQSSAQQIAKTQ
jgi:hypothetical protein